MTDIRELHKEEYGSFPEIVVTAPAVVSLLGEHTEDYGGPVVQYASHLRCAVAVSRRRDSSLRFFSASLNERKKTSVPNLKYRKEDRWSNYLKGFYSVFIEKGAPACGLEVTIDSDIPMKVGLASSSAMQMAFAFAIRELVGISCSDEELVSYIRMGQEEFLETVPRRADFFTMLNASPGNLVVTDSRKDAVSVVPFDMQDKVFLVVDVNVPEHILSEEYGDFDDEFPGFLKNFLKEKDKRSLLDFPVLGLKTALGSIPEGMRKKCIHILEEVTRVNEALQAVERGDFSVFGRILSRSHESLRDNFEVSSPEFDWIAKRCYEISNVYGSRIVGTGFSGSIVAFMDRAVIPEYKEKLDEYERIFGFVPSYMVSLPSDGVEVVSRL
ncbi:galactokinase family protein [Spirochaetia bacterium 38H-sp]|uniref:Galactokinase family protein n=1 Tax=Rarispira pelagica TaxID=3141764 RepID=A0ABU9UB78_9SPIR